MLFAGPLTRWMAPEYAAVPGKLELTTTLTQVMFPFLVLVAVAVACMGMLNALRRFFIPAFAPAMFNVCSILSVFTDRPAVVPCSAGIRWSASAIGTLARRPGAGRGAVAGAAQRGLPLPLRFRAARPAISRSRGADDPGHASAWRRCR